MTKLVWFRSDLRVADNPALWSASRSDGKVHALFVKTPRQWRKHDWGDAKTGFVLGCARELADNLSCNDIRLTILETPSFSGVPKLIYDFAQKHKCTEVHYNSELEVNEVARDEQVRKRLHASGITVHEHYDQTIIQPAKLLNSEGNPYVVFSAFHRAWLREISDLACLQLFSIPLNGEIASPRGSPRKELFPAGEQQAKLRLSAFLEKLVEEYDRDRDRVDIVATSGLSPYLAAGAISIRTCYAAALEVANKYPSRAKGAQKWMSELVWREFYRYVLYHFPRVCKHQPFREETRAIAWRESESDLEAWKAGMTGVPIVDAGMRQLKAESWLPNRMRMIVAMFLVKDLLLDWRLGEKHFMNCLIDGDLASNNGGWQWCASTGNDAAPYFRIMNPYLQSKKCDPSGNYIRRWVPELTGIEGDAVHNPSSFDRAANRYPEPIVDHGEARLRTLQAYKRVSLK